MNREQLKTLINEAIKEVLNEKTPPGFDPELKKQILKQYPGEADKAYATMQKIHTDTSTKKKTTTGKKKSVKEQEDDNASAEPDAGEVEGPTEPQGEHADLLAQIDNIQQTLADLRASVQRHAQGGDEQPVAQDMDDDQLPDSN
jgi:hypothetical protein